MENAEQEGVFNKPKTGSDEVASGNSSEGGEEDATVPIQTRPPAGRNMLQFSAFVGVDDPPSVSSGRFRRIATGSNHAVGPTALALTSSDTHGSEDDPGNNSVHGDHVKRESFASAKGDPATKNIESLKLDFDAAWDDILQGPEVEVEDIICEDMPELDLGKGIENDDLQSGTKPSMFKKLFGSAVERTEDGAEPDGHAPKHGGLAGRKGSFFGIVRRASKLLSEDSGAGDQNGDNPRIPGRKGTRLVDGIPKRKGSLVGLLSQLGGKNSTAESSEQLSPLANIPALSERKPSWLGAKIGERRKNAPTTSPLAVRPPMTPRRSAGISNSLDTDEGSKASTITLSTLSAKSKASNATILAFRGKDGQDNAPKDMSESSYISSESNLAQRAIELEKLLGDNF